MRQAIGIDVGGTKTLYGLIDEAGQITHRGIRPTPKQPDEVVTQIDQIVHELREQHPSVIGIGCGFPALIDETGTVQYGPNIVVSGINLGDHLRDCHKLPVVLDNDANTATWAEFRIGAGKVAHTGVVMFTLGTGVGGGLVIGGQLVTGTNGYAGELGHMIIDDGGRPGTSGIAGELEAYASGTAMVAMAAEAYTRGAFDGTELAGDTPPTGEALTAAAISGDETARQILSRAGHALGLAAATLVNVFDPEVVIVGGGAAAGGNVILEPARQTLRQHTLAYRFRPEVPILPAELGVYAGLIGAGLLLHEHG